MEMSLEFCGENEISTEIPFSLVPKMIVTFSTSRCFNEADSKQCTVCRQQLTTVHLFLGYSSKGYI